MLESITRGSPPVQYFALTAAEIAVITERRRQVSEEGWTASHDDHHSQGEMIEAAACYAVTAGASNRDPRGEISVPPGWPWASVWWKPGTPRRMLVKAAALLVAEIERLDRKNA